MNVFISYSHRDDKFARKISDILSSDGFDVFIDNKIPIGNNIYRDIGKGIARADAIIIIISKSSENSDFVKNETVKMLSFFDRGRVPLIIPVVIGKETKIPYELQNFNYITILPDEDTDDANMNYTLCGPLIGNSEKNAIQQIRLILATHSEKIQAEEKERKESEKKVKTGLSIYIADVFDQLRKKEKQNKRFAYCLYIFSGLSIVIVCIFVVAFFFRINLMIINLDLTLMYAVLCLFLSIMFISLSRFLFTLAKSFMVESIRCSDRIHAISFGKFFLDAYGTEATREEVIKAFSSWNIDNGGTYFRNQTADEYDPKLVETISKVINALKSKE